MNGAPFRGEMKISENCQCEGCVIALLKPRALDILFNGIRSCRQHCAATRQTNAARRRARQGTQVVNLLSFAREKRGSQGQRRQAE
jgi:hypothetical protein